MSVAVATGTTSSGSQADLVEHPSFSPPTRTARLSASPWTTPLCLIGLYAVALGARLVEIDRSYDIFVDEISYSRIAMNLAHGSGLTLYGKPFDLHPPTAFALWATVLAVAGWHGGIEQTIFLLRHITAAIGALTPVAVFILVARARPRWVALVAGFVLALDPFAILYDSRVMLEAPAQAATAGMFAALAVAASCTRLAGRRRWPLLAAGLCAAMAVTTKETFGMVAILALVVLLVTRWTLPRRDVAAVLGMAVAGYALSVIGTGISSGFAPWWRSKTDDLLRLVGIRQETGFNSPTVHVSLLSRVFADASLFLATYLILAVGSLVALFLLWRLRHCLVRPARFGPHQEPSRRDRVVILLSVWTLSAGAYLAYATLFGSIEEQMYYILLAPAVASVVVALSDVFGTARRPLQALGAAILALVLLFDAAAWWHVHTTPDDEYAAFLTWEAVHVPPGSVISVTEYSAQFLLTGVVLGQWNTVAGLRAHRVDYVLLSTTLVKQGYGLGTPAFLADLEHNATLVFQDNGRSDGSLQLYDVRSISGATK